MLETPDEPERVATFENSLYQEYRIDWNESIFAWQSKERSMKGHPVGWHIPSIQVWEYLMPGAASFLKHLPPWVLSALLAVAITSAALVLCEPVGWVEQFGCISFNSISSPFSVAVLLAYLERSFKSFNWHTRSHFKGVKTCTWPSLDLPQVLFVLEKGLYAID